MKGLTLTVSQLNEYVRKSFAADPMVQHICLVGEISNYKAHVSGHWYFSLKDEDASISCAMFRQAAATVRFRPENGARVRLFGSVGLYAKTGSYQFYAERMEPDGVGDLFVRFERLKQRLMAEGLFDASLKKPLPLLPKGIGVITSSTGAVIHDITQVSWRRNPGMPLYLCPVKVQGEGAAGEIAAALRLMDGFQAVDVLIVGRGGGSMEDLWAFNEEEVARAIVACSKPVVSAVGHETDFTIADFVADVRAATPSAAAEMCVRRRDELLAAVRERRERGERAVEQAIAQSALTLERLRLRLTECAPSHRLQRQSSALALLEKRLDAAADRQISAWENRLARAAWRVKAASPLAPLARGYGVILKDGKPLQGVGDAALGDTLTLRVKDGSIRSVVNDIHREE